MAKKSRIVAFYSGTGSDAQGRTLAQVQRLSLIELEQIHDYIQWLFPLPEASAFNTAAPVLTDADILEFRSNDSLRRELVRSLRIMLEFYGLVLVEDAREPHVRCGPTFEARASNWITRGNHNFLRITRILRSLVVLGASVHAQAFLACLAEIFPRFSNLIGERTWNFWNNALSAGQLSAAPGTH